MKRQLRTRPTARVVLLDEDDRLLMLRIHDPATTLPTPDFWLLVGGGVEPGETYEEAARREVREETGIRDVEIGRFLWARERIMADGVLMTARYFLARVPSGSPVTFDGHEPLEAATTVGYRWFRHEEILAREATETFLPVGLGRLLGAVLRAS